MKRVLITSTQYPYNGGAATNAVALIKYFRANGCLAAGIFFDKTDHSVDPDEIGGIWRVKDKTYNQKTKELVTKFLNGEPEIILAKNYVAPVLSKDIFPDSKVAYMVTGSPQMRILSKKKISAQLYLKSEYIEKFDLEIQAINKSDIVIPNSRLGKRLLYKHYGNLNKITEPIDTSMALNGNFTSIEFQKRKYDLAFIVSNFSREVKNAKFAKEIFKKLPHYQKIAVGQGSQFFSNIPNTETLDLLNHQQVLDILSNTKVVICTSFYDASPNIIKEGLACQANILISKNCGWSENYPVEFVCDDVYDLNQWIKKINYLRNQDIRYSLNLTHDNKEIIEKIKEIL